MHILSFVQTDTLYLKKSGYFVSYIKSQNKIKNETENETNIEYNFDGECADPECFDVSLWQKYIKNALRQKERLLTYSQTQGEYDLRCAISKYIREKRNVIASPDRIVIGAGVGVLLNILAFLFDNDKTVSFPDKSFIQEFLKAVVLMCIQGIRMPI